MPGLAMDATQSQTVIKDEDDEHGDFFIYEDEDDHDLSTQYKSRPQLSQPGVYMRSLAYLINGLEVGKIDVDPEYQREVVWTADRMTSLVNSVMENFYIPPIILNKKDLPTHDNEDPKSILVCVDGKQRLSSVHAFVKGLIPCHDHRGEKWYFCDQSRKTRNVFSDAQQRQFLGKEFCSFEYENVSQEQEEDLFARVQMGMQLTPAEKMRAQTGPWQELGRLFVDDFPVVFELLKDRSRAKDFQMALACFSQIIEAEHPSSANGIPMLKTNHTSLPKLIKNEAAIDDRTKSHLASVFNTFKNLINEDPDVFVNVERKLKSVQTFAPVEMVAVAVLISMYSETRNNKLLLGDIRYMRNILRENFVDLRLNAAVWKFIWDYIDNLEQIRGAVDGTTIDRATQPHELEQPPQPLPSSSSTTKRGRPTAKTQRQPKRQKAASNIQAVPPTPQDTRGLPIVVRQEHARAPSLTSATSKQAAPRIRTPVPLTTPIRSVVRTSVGPALNPSEARQKRVAELDSFRAPVAPMGSLAALLQVTPTAQRTIGDSTSKTPVRTQFIRGNPPSKSCISTATVTREDAAENLLNTRASIPQESRPSFIQCDGAIDLTSDNEIEEERQNLLTSFRKPDKPTLDTTQGTAVKTELTSGRSTNKAGSTKENSLLIDDAPQNGSARATNVPRKKDVARKKNIEPSGTNPYKR